METVLSSLSPVSPLVDLLPLSLGPETPLPLSLDDPETAQYTHTLTVTGRIGGLYNRTVSNNKPSTASASITLEGIYVFNHYYNIMQIMWFSLTCSNYKGANIAIYAVYTGFTINPVLQRIPYVPDHFLYLCGYGVTSWIILLPVQC